MGRLDLYEDVGSVAMALFGEVCAIIMEPKAQLTSTLGAIEHHGDLGLVKSLLGVFEWSTPPFLSLVPLSSYLCLIIS